MNNTRFSTLIHILTLLGKRPEEWLSSEWIATSIQTNPVIVRKELGFLQEKGWVVSKKGKDGGYMLNVSSCAISLADIYEALQSTHVLGKKNDCSTTDCPIGQKINHVLDSLFQETDHIVYQSLAQKSLKSFVDQFD